MQRRILLAIIGTVVIVGLVLGIPLSTAAWIVVEDSAREDMNSRLKVVSGELVRQEEPGGVVRDGHLDLTRFRRAVPADGRLVLTFPVPDGTQRTSSVSGGTGVGRTPLSETVALGAAGWLTLEVASAGVRKRQGAAIGIVLGAVVVSILVGTAVGMWTARRLSIPMRRLADRAGRMAEGDFRSPWVVYGIPELDRVSRALEAANKEIVTRLEREGAIAGQVSHQLRSRLTAIALRLDELSMHSDQAVVGEAEAAHQQVERLTAELDEMVLVMRNSDAAAKGPSAIEPQIDELIAHFLPRFRREGRAVRTLCEGEPTAWMTPSRFREAMSVLIDNSLVHGAGDCVITVLELSGSEMVRVAVSDQGDGIPDEYASLIFAQGFSGAESSGVGLALAKTLVEADGGRLELTSRRPPTFTIVVPMRAGVVAARTLIGEPR